MKVNLYILRHGRTANNLNSITQDINDDIGLSEEAYVELNDNRTKILQTLCSKHDSIVILQTSTMLRAVQTTAKLAEMLTLANQSFSVSYDDRMHEVDFGKFGSMPDNAKIDGFDMSYYRGCTMLAYKQPGYDFEFPGGEKCSEVRHRVIACLCDVFEMLDCLAKTGKNKVCNIVLIGHNRWFRHMLAEIDDNYRQDMFARKLPHGQLISIDVNKVAKFYHKVQKCKE